VSIHCHKTLHCIHSTESADGDVRTRFGISLRLPWSSHMTQWRTPNWGKRRGFSTPVLSFWY